MKNVNVKKLIRIGATRNFSEHVKFLGKNALTIKHNFSSNTLKKSSAGKYIRIFLS